MYVIGINGSPRKHGNTATLLEHSLKGAESKGAETALVHLYDLEYTGCTSCFACKTLGGKSYGRCAVKDGLTPLLKKIEQDADAIILGSPIYFGTDTGMMRSFLERLMFPYLTYTLPHGTLFPRKILTGFIYTMNIPENMVKEYGYTLHFATNENVLAGLFGHSEHLCAYDTYQFKDYSKVLCTMFDAKKKAERKKTVFPKDCKKAFLMGVRFAQKNPV
ncbi:MAG: flavodoxin family protein [Methanoregula sp.]|jgi:multimeric flavodoxin WrbA|uniref:flavodoxin family protein n=1 Tax=Methanoregula sp. TaxID=2052170 RepID=UPI003D0BD5D6